MKINFRSDNESPAAEAVLEAAFRSVKKGSELIDLTKHQGEHPRMGAADVVPFIPMSGVKKSEAIELARRLAKRIADELTIPTYLYEDAATRPDRARAYASGPPTMAAPRSPRVSR